MTEGERRRSLPKRIRHAAVACMLMSAAVGFTSAIQALNLGQLSELRERRLLKIPILKDTAPVEGALIRALEPIRGVRAAILSALSVACAFSFVAAGRLLYPRGLSRETMRRLLGAALLVAAVLRTIDGAQWAVVMQRVAREAVPQILEGSLDGAIRGEIDPKQLIMLFNAVLVLQTGLVVGAFTLLAHYFRLHRVKEGIAAAQD